MKNILLDDRHIPMDLEGMYRLKSYFETRDGVFTPLERLILDYPKAQIYYVGSNSKFTGLFLERNQQVKPLNPQIEIDLVLSPERDYLPAILLEKVPKRIAEDFVKITTAIASDAKRLKQVEIVGDRNLVLIQKDVSVSTNVVFDTSNGPIVIGEGVQIDPFSFLRGPVYIHKNAKVSNARIGPGCIVGEEAKVSGNIERVILGDFTNKAHEGTIDNAYIGNWVNIAALSSTGSLVDANEGVGATICDHVRVAGACLMNAGVFVDMGSVLWLNKIEGYYPPFSYLDRNKLYDYNQFIQNTKKVMSRRNKKMSLLEELYFQYIHSNVRSNELAVV